MLSRKVKKIIIAANLGLIGLALPISMFSNWLNANLLADVGYEPVRTITTKDNLDLQVYDNFAEGADPKLFQKIIIEQIDTAQEEITVAMYSFNIEEIKQALLRAANRGVKIQILFYLNNSNDFTPFWADAAEKIPPIYIGGNIPSDNYSMHHKFMLVDPELPSRKLLTGSWNWSYMQEDLDPNILLATSNSEIINSYSAEVRRLSSGYNGFNKFKVPDYRPWTDQINFADGKAVEVWFSPGRERYSIQNRVLDLINSAEQNIDVANTIVDSTEIAAALIKQARAGLKVRVIFDHLNVAPEVSIYNYLQKRKDLHHIDNLELIISGEKNVKDSGLYSIFHHHNLIVDQETVLTGTANWTFGGFFLNDENFLVIKDPSTAKKFTEIFENYLQHSP